jgi:hypothetical protein
MRKPPHIPVRLAGHPGRRVTFSCSCKRKSPKRTRPRYRAGAARRCATGRRGSADGPSWPAAECARSLARTRASAGLSVRPSPRHRGVESEERSKSQRRWVPAFAGTTRRFASASLLCASASLLWLPGSLSAAARARRKQPKGARARCARVRCQATDGLSANLRSALAQSPASSATAAAWVASLWLLSLAGQRK